MPPPSWFGRRSHADFRPHTGANIRTFGDAAWWAATAVAYGDRYPITAEGRLVAVGLMVTGIALLGVITAALASWFVEKLAEVQIAEERTEVEVTDLAAELRALRAEVRAFHDGDQPKGCGYPSGVREDERGVMSDDQPDAAGAEKDLMWTWWCRDSKRSVERMSAAGRGSVKPAPAVLVGLQAPELLVQ